MHKFKNVICGIMIVSICFNGTMVMGKSNEKAEAAEDAIVEEIIEEKVLGALDSVLDSDDNELSENLEKVLETHSDNWFVKIMKKIISVLTDFLNKLFALATEAAKIEVK